MQPLPTAAKAYNMLRQEEKQRDTHKQPLNAPIALNTYKSPYNVLYNSSKRNNTPQPNTPSTNNQPKRRGVFRKGITCAYCMKKGHSKEECYKLLVNMVTGESSNSAEQGSFQATLLEPLPIPDETHVYARMDQLQNQLNQGHDSSTHGILHGGLCILLTASLPSSTP
ncbi:cysteine-rich receptor-like protein kinase 8 [Tanacetum coccineum]